MLHHLRSSSEMSLLKFLVSPWDMSRGSSALHLTPHDTVWYLWQTLQTNFFISLSTFK